MTDKKDLVRNNFLKFIRTIDKKQIQVAKELGMPQSYLSDILNRKGKNFTEKIMISIAETYPYLNLTWMLSSKGEMMISNRLYEPMEDTTKPLNEPLSSYTKTPKGSLDEPTKNIIYALQRVDNSEVVIVADKNGSIIFANNEMRKQTGYPLSDVSKKPLSSVLKISETQQLDFAIKNRMKFRSKLDCFHKDNSKMICNIEIEPTKTGFIMFATFSK